MLTQLIQQAIEERKQKDHRTRAIDHLLAMRQQAPPVTTKAVHQARLQGASMNIWGVDAIAVALHSSDTIFITADTHYFRKAAGLAKSSS